MITLREWLNKENPPLPKWFYHVTIDPEGILKTGFKTAEQLGSGSDVLGGSIQNAVSFTTEKNAENYFEGLKIWKDAAQGKYNFDELGRNTKFLVWLEQKFPVSARRQWAIINKARHHDTNEKLMFNLLQQISHDSRGKFPLIMGSHFPDRLKTATTVAIMRVSSMGPQNVRWNPGEEEWKVFDPENLDLKTLGVVKREF